MGDRRTPKRETLSGMPYITTEEVEAFNAENRNFTQDYEIFKGENPELARALLRHIGDVESDFPHTRRMIAAAAVHMYMILREKAVLNTIEKGMIAIDPTNDDAGDGADPPPSA